MISSAAHDRVEPPPGTTSLEALGAAAILLLTVLLFLADGLPAGTAPVCVDPLYANVKEVPFDEVRPDGFEPHNPYLSDHALVFNPWLRFMNRAVRDGEIPWWSPHSGGGVPFVGNLSAAFFFPTTWLCLLPPDVLTVERGMLWGAVFRLWFAGFFGYLLLRRLGVGRIGAMTGAFGLTFFGYQVVWLFYSLSNVACMIPFCLWLADRFASRPTAGRGTAFGLGMAVQFLGGHAETSVALAIAVTAWFVARATAPDATRPPRSMALRFVAAGVLSVMLCAYQILPFAEYLWQSQGRWERLVVEWPEFIRTSVRSLPGLVWLVVAATGFCFAWRLGRRDPTTTGFGRAALAGLFLAIGVLALLPLGLRPQLLLAIEPDLFGSPLVEGYRGPETYTDVTGGYAGALIALLALAYVMIGARRRVANTFGALLAFAWLLPAQVEPLYSLLKSIPPFDLAANTRLLPLAGVAASVLAAFAVDGIARTERAAFRRGLPRFLVALGVAAMIALPYGRSHYRAVDAGREDPTLGMILAKNGLSWKGWAQGHPFSPSIRPRGHGQLIIPLEVEVPDDVRSVRFEVDGAAFGSAVVVDGVASMKWDVTRFEAGRYPVLPIGVRADGSEVEGLEVNHGIDRDPSITSRGAWRIAAAAGLLLVLAWFASSLPWLVVLVPIGVLAELFLFGRGYNAFVPEEQVFPETSVTSVLTDELDARAADGEGPFRVWAEEVILQPNMHYAYDLQTARSYDQLEVRRFNQWMGWVTGGAVPFTQWNHRTVDYTSPLFDVLNVGYVVTSQKLDHLDGFTLVHERLPRARVYRHEDALPRAFVAPAAVDIRPALESGSPGALLAHDPRRTAFLEEEPPTPLGGTGSVRVAAYGLHEIELEVDTTGPAMLVLSDNWYPGWEATVDGEDRRIYRSHLTFRAVPVPAGVSRVIFRYRPGSVRLGVILAVLGGLGALGFVFRARRRALRGGREMNGARPAATG